MKEELERLIRDILGDFPQGFNAGVVAGVPGWSGDIGYLLQEYPRALLTDTPLRPPVEYAGTTDSIAKAAGYEIPGTLSGQLGAAVGGLLSPGPGDLARFSPLLGAIPFWHGSPHKFDAFDLSKMGSGEGAQAYGWGAYGAESAKVAREYQKALTRQGGNHSPLFLDGEEVFQVGKHGTRNYVQLSRSAYSNGDPVTGILADMAGDALRENLTIAQLKARYKEKPWLMPGRDKAAQEIALKEMGKRLKKNAQDGYFYRGEYAWPDAAKETATPLTGEDLLQWDKPLSEQSPRVREGLAVLDPDMWHPDGADYDPSETGQMIYHRLLNMKRDYAIEAGRNADTTLAASQAMASKDLADVGIPGIRYLDGQSRDGGSGTFNYVMFDDKGIKLLERNGKPIRGLLNP